jgi:hypothetical protein
MERNWLIRTTQNQILGPVAKSKVLEFIEKGALGNDDEVASGNGYWFSLKEKDLVDKYLYGDIPQGYNPISESKSVLSKRENPEKTTSINTAPANSAQDKNKSTLPTGISPKDEDLEYPDSGSDITLVGVSLNKLTLKPNLDSGKLPGASDLEFPDMGEIAKNISSTPEHKPSHASVPVHGSSKTVTPKSAPEVDLEFSASANNFKYPEDSNLDYPDLTAVTSNKTQTHVQTQAKASSPSHSNHTQTMTVAMAKSTAPASAETEEEDRDFTVVLPVATAAAKSQVEEIVEKPVSEKRQIENLIGPIIKEKKNVKPTPTPKPVEERKLLHDRKKQAHVEHLEEEEAPVAKRPVVSEELKSRNDNYLLYLVILLVIIIVVLFVYYYKTILNKPLPV